MDTIKSLKLDNWQHYHIKYPEMDIKELLSVKIFMTLTLLVTI